MPASPEQTLQQLLRNDGAVLIRQKKHLVYRLSNGQSFTVAKTASDRRAAANNVADLRNILGIRLVKAPASRDQRTPRKKKVSQPTRYHLQSGRSEEADNKNRRNLMALSKAIPRESKLKRVYERRDRPQAYTYSAEVLQEANRIFQQQGRKAMERFLGEQRNRLIPANRGSHHLQEREMPSAMEVRVHAAREFKTELEHKIEQCKQTIAEAQSVISATQQEQTDTEDKLKKVTEVLSWHEQAMQQIESIDPLLTNFQRLDIKEAKARTAASKPARTTTRHPIGTTEIITRSMPLLQKPDASVNAQDIVEYLKRETGHDLDKRAIHSALAYGVRRLKVLEPVPDRRGEYRAKVRGEATKANGAATWEDRKPPMVATA